MQISHNGLLRSLLFQLLKKFPDLILRMFPERWEVYSLFGHDHLLWSQQELRQAFKLLAKEEHSRAKYCVFIDSLDEFDGDHTNSIDLLKDIASLAYIKICVSSRPWVIFEDAFKHKPSLMLENLTYPDIKHYINSKFGKNANFVDLEKREPQYAGQLLEAIAQKAAGMFLWVYLVVQSLLAGLTNGDRVSDLQRRLKFLPPDLENPYEKMLNSLHPFYFEHASQYFQLVRAAQEPVTLLCLFFADEEPDFVKSPKLKALDDHEKISRADIMRRSLNSRCEGLLVVASGPVLYRGTAFSIDVSPVSSLPVQENCSVKISSPADSKVQYLHRTVKDLLESSKVWHQLEFWASHGAQPHDHMMLVGSLAGSLVGSLNSC